MKMSWDMKRDFCKFEKINRPFNQEWEEKLVLRKTQLSEVRIRLKIWLFLLQILLYKSWITKTEKILTIVAGGRKYNSTYEPNKRRQ